MSPWPLATGADRGGIRILEETVPDAKSSEAAHPAARRCGFQGPVSAPFRWRGSCCAPRAPPTGLSCVRTPGRGHGPFPRWPARRPELDGQAGPFPAHARLRSGVEARVGRGCPDTPAAPPRGAAVHPVTQHVPAAPSVWRAARGLLRFARSVAGAGGRGGDRRWPRPWHPAGGGDGGAERGGNEAAVTPRTVRRVPASGRVRADREREGHGQARRRRAGGLGRSSVPSLLFALQKSLRCPKPQLAHLRSGENARTGPRGP